MTRIDKITAVAPLGGTASVSTSPVETLANPSDDGYGPHGRCNDCGHGIYSCTCNVEEPDVMHVEDMRRIYPRFFERESGWALAERSALGMAK